MIAIAEHKSWNEHDRRTNGARRAFTLIELMIAIGVIIALVAVTLPAFRAIQAGNRESGGINAVSAALGTARSLAVRNGRDVGAVFRFDVERQVCSIQLVEFLAMTDDAGNDLGESAIFIPVAGQSVVELPPGAGVFGYGYGATQAANANFEEHQNWYGDLGKYYYDNRSKPQIEKMDPWLFPRSDVRLLTGSLENAKQNDVNHLESFMIRFGPNGTVVTSTEELAAAASGANEGYLELNHLHTQDDEFWESKYLEWTPQILDMGNGEIRIIDELQIRAVPYIAVVDLTRLASESGIAEPWFTLGRDHDNEGDVVDWNSNQNQFPDHIDIDLWINENATVLSFNRYTGNIMREYRR